MVSEININNLNISYYESENDVGSKNILFLHGWGQNKFEFLPTMNYFEEEYNIWSIDFPGFGDSDEPKTPLTVEDYASTVEEFLKSKNIEEVTIIAHSFGARVAFVLSSKIKINNLVLTGAAGIKPKRGLVYKMKIFKYKAIKGILNLPGFSKYKKVVLDSYGSEDYKEASFIMKKTLSLVVNEDLKKYFPNIKCPTLLYWGDKDNATPIKDGKIMNKMISNSTLVIKENSSHYAFLENIDDFNLSVKKFLSNGIIK